MNVEWEIVRLKDVTSILGDGLHGTPVYDEAGTYYFINGNNLNKGKIELNENTKKTTKAEYLKHKKDLNERTILVSINGTLGNVALYNGEPVILGKSACYFNVLENVNKIFVRYVVSSNVFQTYLESLATGTTIKNVSLKLMREFTFKLPPLEIQNKIASVLAFLDDKITLNTQTNQTLEAIVQAIFKSWFVDFDPVKAKMEVLNSGGNAQQAERAAMIVISGKDDADLAEMESRLPVAFAELAETAALFPAEMVESELGLIPLNWKKAEIIELAYLNNNIWSKKNAPEEIEYVDLANTKWGVIQTIEKIPYSIAPSRARRILKKGDTIFGTVRPGNGSFALIGEDGCTGSTGFAVLSPKSDYFSEFIYLCITQVENINKLARLADGGAYPAVNPDIIASTTCKLPSDTTTRISLLEKFHTSVFELFHYREFNFAGNRSLSTLRDTLLPKLLSGEMRVPTEELSPCDGAS